MAVGGEGRDGEGCCRLGGVGRARGGAGDADSPRGGGSEGGHRDPRRPSRRWPEQDLRSRWLCAPGGGGGAPEAEEMELEELQAMQLAMQLARQEAEQRGGGMCVES